MSGGQSELGCGASQIAAPAGECIAGPLEVLSELGVGDVEGGADPVPDLIQPLTDLIRQIGQLVGELTPDKGHQPADDRQRPQHGDGRRHAPRQHAVQPPEDRLQ